MRVNVVVGGAMVLVVLCYLGAGSPSVRRLLSIDVLSYAIALRPLTYHWANHSDRSLSESDIPASRFYVLVLATLCLVAGVIAVAPSRPRRFAYLMAMSVVLFVVFVFAECQAYYTVG